MEIGDKFKLTENAIENYGEQYRDITFEITSWADHYVASKDYCKNPGAYPHGHPGYDGSGKLYDSKPLDTDLEFNYSVYTWEVREFLNI